jgi:hypothetical protein
MQEHSALHTIFTGALKSGNHSHIVKCAIINREYLEKRAAHLFVGSLPKAGDKAFNNKVFLSYTLWQMLFPPNRPAVGKTLEVNGYSYVIAGVLDLHFDSPEGVDLWIFAEPPSNPRRGDPLKRDLQNPQA